MKAPQKILVIATQRLGDVLLATPLIRSLKQAWPHADIDVMVYKNTSAIIEANPDIHKIIQITESEGFLRSIPLLLKLIRRYDLSLSTQCGDRQTLYAWLASQHSIGLLENKSLKNRWKKFFLSRNVLLDNLNTHTVIMNLALADLLHIDRCYDVTVAWTDSDEQQVKDLLCFSMHAELYALLHVFPKFSYKMWHTSGWITVARWLDKRGIRPVLTGGDTPEEMMYVAELARFLPDNTINMAGKLSIAQVGFLAKHALVHIGPDTAITHMAAALGVPTVALYGPSNPVKWGPWPKNYNVDSNPYVLRGSQSQKNVELIQGTGNCVPCREEGCERHIKSLSRCLQAIEPSTVITAIEKVLRKTSF